MKNQLKSFANEGEYPKSDVDVVGLGNAVEIGADGWALVPYGDWPHAEGLQHFGREEAQTIVGYFKNTWNRIKRAVVGLPIFKGHPDLPAPIGNEYPDKGEYGQVADMDARPDGLAIKLILSEAGATLVERGLKYISPHWLANAVGKTTAGKTIYAPVFLKSIGLTRSPNIPCPSLVNSATSAAHGAGKTTQENQVNKEALIKLLGLANEATEEQITAAIVALQKRPEPSALANETAAKTAAEGKVTALEGEKSTLATKVTEAQTALANERKARIDEVVADAIRKGVVTEAEKATWTQRLKSNFEAESKVLANAKPVIKTKSELPDLLAKYQAILEKELANAGGGGGTDMTDEDKGAKIKKFCNEEMAKLGHITNVHSRYNAAFTNVKRAHPELFGAVEPKA